MTTENVLDCVGIDLVLGLSNDHGHIGILFCTDKLSKYVVAYKIKAKEQNHIASKLKKFILTYGPPKCILSDKGGEFCNELINNMLRLTGTEHKITSAYNPRTNGQTERVNQTIMTALRKHTEADQNNWHLWLDYVVFSYNSRVHSSTNFTPFELMFGRKVNKFESWKTLDNDKESFELA